MSAEVSLAASKATTGAAIRLSDRTDSVGESGDRCGLLEHGETAAQSESNSASLASSDVASGVRSVASSLATATIQRASEPPVTTETGSLQILDGVAQVAQQAQDSLHVLIIRSSKLRRDRNA